MSFGHVRTGAAAATIGLVSGLFLALSAPAAQASLMWDHATYDFGSPRVGVAHRVTFNLTATCEGGMGTCSTPPGGSHVFGVPAVTGSGDFTLSTPNTCVTGSLVVPTFPGEAKCQTAVSFKPSSLGIKSGLLDLPMGPDIPLSGGKPQEGTGSKKKCKKKGKKSALAAKKKKCGKKKK